MKVQAIVSALDDPYRDEVENIWGELKAVFGLQSVIGSTRPHLTYHVAAGYNAESIDEALTAIARETPRFAIETHGLGVFHGDETVIYLHLTRNDALTALHHRLWMTLDGIAVDVRPMYAAATWMPHITLAIGDVDESQLPVIMQFLNRREYEWTIPATNLSFIADVTSASEPWRRFDLGAPAPPSPA